MRVFCSRTPHLPSLSTYLKLSSLQGLRRHRHVQDAIGRPSLIQQLKKFPAISINQLDSECTSTHKGYCHRWSESPYSDPSTHRLYSRNHVPTLCTQRSLAILSTRESCAAQHHLRCIPHGHVHTVQDNPETCVAFTLHLVRVPTQQYPWLRLHEVSRPSSHIMKADSQCVPQP